jgi:1,4-alpha-glucan branching enzyme
MAADILQRKETAFVLWRAVNGNPAPTLVIGELQEGAPITLNNVRQIPLLLVAGFTDLWQVPAANCQLVDGRLYHYWFEVSVSRPGFAANARVRITDPLAFAVDWRVLAPRLAAPFTDDDRYPAGVIRFANGKLVSPDNNAANAFANEPSPDTLPPNNRIVIYELPTTWMRTANVGGRDMGVGTFRDITALIDANAQGENFADLDVLRVGRAYLKEIGVNTLELLPPADSVYNRQWGYGTTNYCAPDFELGFPSTYSFPTPNRDLAAMVATCHTNGMRFFVDQVMAFSKLNPYLEADCDNFFILDPGANKSDPDAHNSRGDGTLRNGFGATLFRYARMMQGYDPISGQVQTISPARQWMKTALNRWMADFHVDGIRLDSIENVTNWDFIGEYKNLGRALNQQRFAAKGVAGADAHFLVVGEELSEPLNILQKTLDGLWHESFKTYIRCALLGQNHPNESTFEYTVRKMIDCRQFGYTDLAQAVIYLTSHDVEGFRNERLFNFFMNNGVNIAEPRIKLAFACLLTAVGVPMILAGDEFADQHDLFGPNGQVTQDGGKQVDPVNFSRLSDDWRTRIKDFVSRLTALRTSYDALSVNDTNFIHVDFNDNKRVLVWQRGLAGSDNIVVVVANFSDYTSPGGLNGEYVVPNWPGISAGKQWREVPQNRNVPLPQAGREPIFPWEAKVYAVF